jgi:hypothetical protein
MLSQRSWLCVIRGVCVAAVFSLSGAALWAQENTVGGEEVPSSQAPAGQPAPVDQPAPVEQPAPVQQPTATDQAVAPDAAPPSRVVYKSIDSTGKVTFTDIPPKDRPSEAVKVHAANTMPIGASAAPSENGSISEKKKGPVKYSRLEITSPANDETLGQDVDSVTLAAQLEPGLQDGHTFQLYFDGNPVGSNEMSYTVNGLERGTHTVEAKVFDKNKRVLKSASPVQFHVRRISALNKVSAATLPAGGNQPGTPTGGFGSPKGAGGMGGSGGSGGAGVMGGAGSPGDAIGPRGVATRTKGK